MMARTSPRSPLSSLNTPIKPDERDCSLLINQADSSRSSSDSLNDLGVSIRNRRDQYDQGSQCSIDGSSVRVTVDRDRSAGESNSDSYESDDESSESVSVIVPV